MGVLPVRLECFTFWGLVSFGVCRVLECGADRIVSLFRLDFASTRQLVARYMLVQVLLAVSSCVGRLWFVFRIYAGFLLARGVTELSPLWLVGDGSTEVAAFTPRLSSFSGAGYGSCGWM